MQYKECSVSGYEFGDFIVLGRSPVYYNKMVVQCKKCGSTFEMTLHNKATIKDLKGVCKNCQNKKYVEELVGKQFGNIEILEIVLNTDTKFYTDCSLKVKCNNCGREDIITLEYFKSYIAKKKKSSTNKYCKYCYEVKDKTVDILKSRKDTKHLKWDLPRNVTYNKATNMLRAYVRINGLTYTKDTNTLKSAMEFVSNNKLLYGVWTKTDSDAYLATYDKYKNISLGNKHLFEIRQERKRKRVDIEKSKRIAKRKLFESRIQHILKKASNNNVYVLTLKDIERVYTKNYNKDINNSLLHEKLRSYFLRRLNKDYIKVDTYPVRFGLIENKDKVTVKSKFITLDGLQFKTQREVADFLKISKQRVNQLVKKYGHDLYTDINGKIKG